MAQQSHFAQFLCQLVRACQSGIPVLVAFQNQYGKQGLQVVGIGMDDEVKLRNVHRTLGINYPVLSTNSPAPCCSDLAAQDPLARRSASANSGG